MILYDETSKRPETSDDLKNGSERSCKAEAHMESGRSHAAHGRSVWCVCVTRSGGDDFGGSSRPSLSWSSSRSMSRYVRSSVTVGLTLNGRRWHRELGGALSRLHGRTRSDSPTARSHSPLYPSRIAEVEYCSEVSPGGIAMVTSFHTRTACSSCHRDRSYTVDDGYDTDDLVTLG
nr:hypothetical protein CFP56_31801 [Quercus suber]